jgi:hypothetical protein
MKSFRKFREAFGFDVGDFVKISPDHPKFPGAKGVIKKKDGKNYSIKLHNKNDTTATFFDADIVPTP